jgi:hypothetical protein
MADRELVVELAAAVVAQVSPEELTIFEEEVAAYFAAPPNAVAQRRRDEPVGFGLDLTLFAPYALAVGTTVVNMLSSMLTDEARDAARPVVAQLVRRVLRRAPNTAGEPPQALTVAQAALVRRTALSRAEELGLPRTRAKLLADAVVGGLMVRNTP